MVCVYDVLFFCIQKQDESLLEDIWTLLRAGRLEEACGLCRSAGQVTTTLTMISFWTSLVYASHINILLFWQPWRASSLSPFGGLNQFPSVEALVENGKNRTLQAIEFENGIGHQLHLWKWASYCASEVGLYANIGCTIFFVLFYQCVNLCIDTFLSKFSLQNFIIGNGMCYATCIFLEKACTYLNRFFLKTFLEPDWYFMMS